jgi:adenylylsulfate kinase
VEPRIEPAFAVWATGLPASGKSTLVAELTAQLAARGVDVAALESDALRKVFVRHPVYNEEEREIFYEQMVYVGVLLTRHGVPVIFDATANRRRYRERARQQISKFIEIYVDSPLGVCIHRDPKGIYRRGLEGIAATVPGLQIEYEAPENPDLVVHGDRENPERAAERVIEELVAKGYVK